MPRPCMALPRRAAHVLGFPTGRRSSPGGRRSWGRGRDRPVCRSSCVHTWDTPFSSLRTFTIRRDTLHITYSGRHGVRDSGHPAHAHTAARVLRYMLLTRQKRHLSALTGQSRWILTMHMHTAARVVCCTTPNRRHRMPAPRHLSRHV